MFYCSLPFKHCAKSQFWLIIVKPCSVSKCCFHRICSAYMQEQQTSKKIIFPCYHCLFNSTIYFCLFCFICETTVKQIACGGKKDNLYLALVFFITVMSQQHWKFVLILAYLILLTCNKCNIQHCVLSV